MFPETTRPAIRVLWPELAASHPRPSPTISLGGASAIGPTIVLDFGEELFGGVRLEVLAARPGSGCRLRVSLGESVSEAIAGTYVDRKERVEAGSKLDANLTAFRFALVEVMDPADGVEISMPEAYGLARDVPRLGSFASDDPRLDRIWEAGARTAHLCMQDRVWDGIKRGRTVWAGDLHPASLAIAAAFGPQPIVPDSLDYLRLDTTEPGGAPSWMNGIPAYSLWWVLCLDEWHRLTGDRAYLAGQGPYLADLLGAICDGIGDDGREHFEGWRYLDWATTRDPLAVDAGYHGLTAWALRSAIGLFEVLGDAASRSRCDEALARVARHQPAATASKQALALMVLGGLADARATNRDHLATDPLSGLTPFLGYHVLEARALAGDHAGALDLIRDYWGAMIDLGATTFWEDFDIAWAEGSSRIDVVPGDDLRDLHAGLGRNTERGMSLSLCHAWSAGPTAWLSRNVLGVRPAAPGCRSVRIRPALGNLSWAEGRVPTPLGVVKVRHARRPDGTIETEYEAPGAIEVILGG